MEYGINLFLNSKLFIKQNKFIIKDDYDFSISNCVCSTRSKFKN